MKLENQILYRVDSFSECAARMTSGGPCQRLSEAYFLIKPTINPAKKGNIKMKIMNSGVLVKIS